MKGNLLKINYPYLPVSWEERRGLESNLSDLEVGKVNHQMIRGLDTHITLELYCPATGESTRVVTPWRYLPNTRTLELEEGIGENVDLKLFGLSSKAYSGEISTKDKEAVITHTILDVHEGTGKMNKYIKRQLVILATLRRDKDIKGYWKLYEKLAVTTPFFLLELYNWNPIWYKELSPKQLGELISDYNNCLTVSRPLSSVKEKWVKCGHKWRPLNIAPLGTRLFLSGLNRYLMFWLDPVLCNQRYHGFMFGRGVSTYWKNLLSNNQQLLNQPCILEADFESCFPNVNKLKLMGLMETKYGLPENIRNLISQHINVPIIQEPLSDIPCKSGIYERVLNEDLDVSRIGLAQGLPISPILAVLLIKSGLDDLEKELDMDLEVRCYADDLSMYGNEDFYHRIGGEDFVKFCNGTLSFKSHGLKFDKKKSKWVKGGQESNDLNLLGLSWSFSSESLSSSTRGRPSTPFRKGTLPQNKLLGYALDLKGLSELEADIRLKEYLQTREWILLRENIKGTNVLKYFNRYFSTLLAILFASDEAIIQNFSLKNCRPGSVMSRLNARLRRAEGELLGGTKKLNIHNAGGYLLRDLQELIKPTKTEVMEENLIKLALSGRTRDLELLKLKEVKNFLHNYSDFYNGYDNRIAFKSQTSHWKKSSHLTILER
jgi:hypothetical protein